MSKVTQLCHGDRLFAQTAGDPQAPPPGLMATLHPTSGVQLATRLSPWLSVKLIKWPGQDMALASCLPSSPHSSPPESKA